MKVSPLMLKLPKIKSIIIAVGLLILICLIVLNLGYFQQLVSDFIESRLITWGYLGLFLFVFLLEALPQPFLSALIPFITGVLLDFNIFYLMLLTIIGSVLANYAAYLLGLSLENSAINLFIKEKKRIPRCKILLIEPFYISNETSKTSIRYDVLKLLPEYISVVRNMHQKYRTRIVKTTMAMPISCPGINAVK